MTIQVNFFINLFVYWGVISIGDDFEGDMRRSAEDEETKRWWEITDPMQKTLVEGATGSGQGSWWYDVPEVFRFEQ